MDMKESDRIYFETLRKKNREERLAREAEEAKRQEELQKLGIKQPKPYFEHPGSLENDEATVLYIIAMVISSIFTDRVGFWILWTIIWFNYINRHN